MRKVVWISALACGLSIAAIGRLYAREGKNPPEADRTPRTILLEKLRAGIATDAAGDQGRQYIHFGPMKDGRTLSITTQIVNNSFAVAIAKVGPDEFLIRKGRNLDLEAIYIIDAMIVCAHFPQTVCERMPDYINRVRNSPSPVQAPWLEGAFPALRDAARIATADEKAYKAALLSGVQSVAGLVTLHEIGHAALHHLDTPSPDLATQIDQEGEADGFAASVMNAGGLPPEGLVVALMRDAMDEKLGGTIPRAHPPAICRVDALSRLSIEWLRKHKLEVLDGIDDKAHAKLAVDMMNGLFSVKTDSGMNGLASPDCKPYNMSFEIGYERAASLVDQNTKLTSTVPGQPETSP